MANQRLPIDWDNTIWPGAFIKLVGIKKQMGIFFQRKDQYALIFMDE